MAEGALFSEIAVDTHDEANILPLIGEIDDDLWEAVVDGQPMLLTHGGHPAAVLIDVDTFLEYQTITQP